VSCHNIEDPWCAALAILLWRLNACMSNAAHHTNFQHGAHHSSVNQKRYKHKVMQENGMHS